MSKNVEHFSRHPGYRRMFKENHLTLGLFFPIEAYTGSIPLMNMEEQVKLAKRAEELNFASLVVRDVPLHDPNFGDVGQIYGPMGFFRIYCGKYRKDCTCHRKHYFNLASSFACGKSCGFRRQNIRWPVGSWCGNGGSAN
jgi:hypothetical protein